MSRCYQHESCRRLGLGLDAADRDPAARESPLELRREVWDQFLAEYDAWVALMPQSSIRLNAAVRILINRVEEDNV